MISQLAARPTVAVRPGRAFGAQAPRMMRAQRMIVRADVDKAQVLTDVREIIAEQLGSDLNTIVAESKFVDLGADSLDTVEIMMALEEKFDIQVEEEGAEKISTVAEAVDMICQQITSKA